MGLDLAFFILGLIGVTLFILGIRRIWRWKMLSGGIQGISGALLISLALLIASLAANLHSYQRLSHENPVASLRFEQLGPQHFRGHRRYGLYAQNRRSRRSAGGDAGVRGAGSRGCHYP